MYDLENQTGLCCTIYSRMVIVRKMHFRSYAHLGAFSGLSRSWKINKIFMSLRYKSFQWIPWPDCPSSVSWMLCWCSFGMHSIWDKTSLKWSLFKYQTATNGTMFFYTEDLVKKYKKTFICNFFVFKLIWQFLFHHENKGFVSISLRFCHSVHRVSLSFHNVWLSVHTLIIHNISFEIFLVLSLPLWL